MKNLTSFLLLTLLLTSTAWAQKKVAIVKLLKGDVDALTLGKTVKLKVEDWVEEGSVVKTAEKSFVKLVFIDKSQMNIGPESEMKIEKFSDKDSGVIDLVKGKIRSQVTKDYLQVDRNKSKLFIKTANAVMGVRGTDFLISTNGQTTSTVLFEGAISFNKLENRGEVNTSRLEEIVDRGVNIQPGEFSVADKIHPLPTVPAVLNIGQREALEKNETFDADRSPGNSGSKPPEKSIVPPGLSGESVSNNTSALNTELARSGAKAPDPAPQSAEGFVKGDSIKPTNGAFLHVESGVIIAPPPGSVFDSMTNTFIPPGSVGSVSTTGDYVPPKNVEITGEGKILVATVDNNTGKSVVNETAAPPVVTKNTPVLNPGSGSVFAPPAPPAPPANFQPGGGKPGNREAPIPTNKYDSGNLAARDIQTNNQQSELKTTTRTTIITGP